MKKLSMIALLTAVVLPAFATEAVEVPVVEMPETTATEVSEDAKETELLVQETADDAQDVVAEQEKNSFLHGLQIGVGISGASGLNGFIGYANKDFDSFWAKRFGVRFDFATTSPIKTRLNDAINDVLGNDVEISDSLAITDIAVDAHHYAAMVDFYPFGDTWFLGGWRLTGGYYFGEMNATAHIAGRINELDGGSYEFELGGHKFKYTGNSVHGTAEFDWDYRGPYLGTGFDLGLFSGFKIYMDAGVVFTNKAAQLDLNVPSDNLTMDGNPVDNETVEGVVSDALADTQSELDDFKFYPMVKFGFMYRF